MFGICEAAEALMDDDVTSGDAVKFGEIINILKNLECFASTVEEVDLFNNLQNIVITNAGKDVWQQIGKVNLNAHNPILGAPEHLAMVNNNGDMILYSR